MELVELEKEKAENTGIQNEEEKEGGELMNSRSDIDAPPKHDMGDAIESITSDTKDMKKHIIDAYEHLMMFKYHDGKKDKYDDEFLREHLSLVKSEKQFNLKKLTKNVHVVSLEKAKDFKKFN